MVYLTAFSDHGTIADLVDPFVCSTALTVYIYIYST